VNRSLARLRRAVGQTVILSAIFAVADAGVRRWSLPLPGGVVGAVVLAILLLTGALPIRWFEEGADLLLRWLGLFFVPASVLAIQVWPAVRPFVAEITAVVLGSFLLVLYLTAIVAERWAANASARRGRR
jgi:holin-like protein